MPVTVRGVQVTEGKAKELNFTLGPLNNESVSHTTTMSTPLTTPITASSSSYTSPSKPGDTTEVTGLPATSTAPAPKPQRPQEFRHHHNSDMELFLQRFSTEYPSITRLYPIGKSVQGRLLWVMEISDNPGEHEQGAVSRLYFLLHNVKYEHLIYIYRAWVNQVYVCRNVCQLRCLLKRFNPSFR